MTVWIRENESKLKQLLSLKVYSVQLFRPMMSACKPLSTALYFMLNMVPLYREALCYCIFLNVFAYSISLFSPYSDRHHVSSSIPVPAKSQLGVSAASELAYPCHTSSPDRGLRNRASSEAEAELKYKPATPPPSYNTAISEGKSQVGLAPPSPSPSPSPTHLSSSLDPSKAPLDLSTNTETIVEEEQKEEKQEARGTAVEAEGRETAEGESERHKENKSDEMEENPSSSSMIPNSSAVQDTDEETMPAAQHPGAMNGSLVLEQAPISLIPELRCSVEQAEEIMGTEATGLGLGMGLGLADEARLDDYRCIPVDHAVAVECDEQVLGELDMAGFEEFSRRIYALNENMSSFRRPRKNSEK